MNAQMPGLPCAVCGETGPRRFRIWFDGRIRLYRCRKCGFVAQYPGPERATVVTDYRHFYSPALAEEGRDFMYPERRRGLEDILRRISALKASGDLLDVGCGDGQFLHLSLQAGFRCSGVDGSESLGVYAARRTGAAVIQGLYRRDMFPADRFDVITLVQVLEHIPDPGETLRAARHHLRPGGIVVIEVPSIQAPHFLAYRCTRIRAFVKPPAGVIPTHVGYYSPASLEALTSRCGFRSLEITTGRWRFKYAFLAGGIGRTVDAVLNRTRIGGILYIGRKDAAAGG